jgi:aminoglycoside 2''-phosphotransferase
MDLKPYLQRIRNEFPNLKFKRATMPKQGMDHLALFLDDQWVFRFAKNPEYITHFPNEVKLLDALHEQISLPIPHYEFASKDKSFGGYKKIQGKPLTRAGYKRMSMEARKAIASELGNFLNELHAFPVSKARALGVPAEDPAEYLSTLKREYKQYLEPKITAAEKIYSQKILLESQAYNIQKHPQVMTHNDMLGGHIFLKKNNQIAGIIDFGDKAIGDPAKDFNGLLDIDPAFMKAVYGHYKKKGPTLLSRSVLLRKRGSLSWLAYNAKAGTPKSYARAYRQFKRIMKLELSA